ncbi:SMP-30/gluconolactonase/LRE family protein [Streptomyces sp. NBC_00873]|uniref:ABC transporter permease n=1 Tax=Streptomyces sp. NBC_00873 TaxID=2975852 RepID=UPI003864B66C|nr:SMP-30/gluconolactonase/LRE family protein [Streptomyces sp. NBC_00873]
MALGIAVSIAVGAAWGLLNGVLVTRLKIPSFIITLGTLGMALGMAQVITKGTDVTGLPPQMVTAIGMNQILGLPLPVWIAAIVAVVAGLVLARTRFGRYTYAIGSNTEGARLWIAMWGGGRILRLSPEGHVLTEVPMPVAQPSSCAFGGPDFDVLYVTTAREGLGPDLAGPAGSVLAVRGLGVRGLPAHRFGG